MKMVISHPTGNQYVRNALSALYREHALLRYYTTIGWSRESVICRLGSPGLRNKLSRRSYSIPAKLIRNSPLREFLRLSRPFGNLFPVTIDDVFLAQDRWVASELPRLKSREGLTGVFTHEDGALSTLKAARQLGLDAIYELPIGYWRAGHQIFNEERELKPEWASTLTGLQDPPDKLARKDEELSCADLVICASSFTKATLDFYPGPRPTMQVIPYGAPAPIDFDGLPTRVGKRLRLLFVGGLSQRKGLSYLFDAVKALGDSVELTVIGKLASEPSQVLEDHLAQCKYISSLSHQDILGQMREHDLFIFPSLFEGFGLVLLEAMSQGLPCITTPNTAGPDIIDHGRDGFIVPIRSTTEIVECVEKLLREPELLVAMKRAALAKAAFFSWEKYQDKLLQALRKEEG